MVDKQRIRSMLLKRRKEECYSSIVKKSRKIEQNLFNLREYQLANSILYYVSFDQEANTHHMIKQSITQNKKILVPIPDITTQTIIPTLLQSWDHLKPGAYGILTPPHSDPIKLATIDMVIIPGVGFDISGGRIGHGKGYYDKLLTQIKQAIRVALAFEFQIIDKIPMESHDVTMDLIITESRILQCPQKNIR